jgi:hypothetical protein
MNYRMVLFSLFFFSTTLSLSAMEFGIGPFGLQIDVGIRVGEHDEYVDELEDPICHAILKRHLVEIIVQPSNDSELKRLIVEPYLLGYTLTGELVLKGYKLNEKTIPEDVIETTIYLRRGGVIDDLDEVNDDWRTVRLTRIVRVQVLKKMHFKVRNIEFNDMDETVNVICSVWN